MEVSAVFLVATYFGANITYKKMPSLLLNVSLPRHTAGKTTIKGFAELLDITGNIKRSDENVCEMVVEHIQKEKLSFFLGTVFAHFQDKNIEFLILSIKYLGRKMYTSFKIIENKDWMKNITDCSSDDNTPHPKYNLQRNNETFTQFVEEELEVLQVPPSDISDNEIQRQTTVLNSFRYNMLENNDHYIYEVITPGFKKQELEITKTKRNLYVAGEKKQTRTGRVVYCKIPISGLFRTKIPLPPNHGKILGATQEDGLLVITMAKETFTTEKISIQ